MSATAKQVRRNREVESFTPYTVVMAEGRRVGLLTCKRCGAVVMLDEHVDYPGLHFKWHSEGSS